MDRTAGVSIRLATVLGTLVVLAAVGTVGVTTGGVAAQATNGTNVTYHENPETVSQQGDAERLESWLSGRLTERLRESSVRISEGQYDRADDVFDEEFERRVDQYVDVAGETDGDEGGEGDDSESTARTAFERAQEQQTRLASLRQEYDETYDAYLDARRRGDAEAARRHARSLQLIATEIRRLGGELTRTLASVENQTGQDTGEIEQRVQNEVETVTETQQTIQTETFRMTSLSVATNRSTASVADPVGVRGRLVVETRLPLTERSPAARQKPIVGSQRTVVRVDPVANRSVTVRVGHVVFTPTTARDGTFEVAYRPAFVPVGTENVPVRYLPNTSAPYGRSGTNASLAVERPNPAVVDDRSGPSVSLSVTPDRARFGETLDLRTDMSVDGRPAVGVPVAVAVGGRTVGEGRTGQGGSARTGATVSADFPPGSLDVRSRVSGDDRAAGPLNATATVTIRETATSVTVETNTSATGVTVAGRLVGEPTDGGGFGLASQPVVVRVGETSGTVRTDASGNYEAVVPAADIELTEGQESLQVQVRFDGSGTSIESARARTRLDAAAVASLTGQSGSEGGSEGAPVPGWALVGLLVLVLGGGVVAWWRFRRDGAAAPSEDGAVVLADEAPKPADATDDTPLSEARDALADGATDRAVVAAYGAVRASLTDRFGLEESSTPRELVVACERHFDRETQERLRTLTAVHEQTVFAPDRTEDAGQDAIEAARSLLGSGSSGGDPADD